MRKDIYCKGKYSDFKVFWAFIVNLDDMLIYEDSGCFPSKEMYSPVGEIWAVQFSFAYLHKMGFKSNNNIHYAFDGTKKWLTGEWAAKNPNSKNYREHILNVYKNIEFSMIKNVNSMPKKLDSLLELTNHLVE